MTLAKNKTYFCILTSLSPCLSFRVTFVQAQQCILIFLIYNPNSNEGFVNTFQPIPIQLHTLQRQNIYCSNWFSKSLLILNLMRVTCSKKSWDRGSNRLGKFLTCFEHSTVSRLIGVCHDWCKRNIPKRTGGEFDTLCLTAQSVPKCLFIKYW